MHARPRLLGELRLDIGSPVACAAGRDRKEHLGGAVP
jgi:hypothetical protein